MSSIILCNLSDAHQIIDDERMFWISDVLDALGIPEEVFNAKTIDEYRDSIGALGVEIELTSIGNVNVYKQEWHDGGPDNSGWLPTTSKHLVAQWKEPTYIRKVEGKDVYYEVHLNEWSILNVRKK
jgi:hypothetical protein